MAIKNIQGLKSIRQINRLIAGYKEYGKEFLIHGNRGRKSKHAISIELKDTIETLYQSKYFDCTYTQFTEYLADREHIFLSIAEVGQILREKYILSSRTRKATRKSLKNKLITQVAYKSRTCLYNTFSDDLISLILASNSFQ